MMLRHKTLARASAVAAALVAATLVTAPAAMAAGTLAGLSFIVDPNTNQNLNSGGSGTAYAMKVPTGARCNGDSSQGYTVFSYITDLTTPENLTWTSDGPAGGSVTYPMIDASHSPYTGKTTQVTTGEVLPTGPLTFTDFQVADLPPNSYHVGLACIHTVSGTFTMEQFWDTKMVVTAAAGDPNGWTWQTDPFPQVPEFPFAVVLPLSAGLLLAGAGFLVYRRRLTGAAVLAA